MNQHPRQRSGRRTVAFNADLLTAAGSGYTIRRRPPICPQDATPIRCPECGGFSDTWCDLCTGHGSIWDCRCPEPVSPHLCPAGHERCEGCWGLTDMFDVIRTYLAKHENAHPRNAAQRKDTP